MIKSFKHKGLEKLFTTGSGQGVKQHHVKKLKMQLTALNTAVEIDDMNIPGWRLHPLSGNKKELWTIDVSKNWRVVFKFKNGNAYVCNYEDYY